MHKRLTLRFPGFFSSLREMRDAAIEQNREDRRLMFAAKLENAERMRRVKQQRRREMLEAMSYTDARLQHAKVRQRM